MTRKIRASVVPEVRALLAWFCACGSAIAGCSASGSEDGSATVGNPAAPGTGGVPSLPSGSGSGGSEASLCAADDCAIGPNPGPTACGDGALTLDEACDDGNRDAADGCSADCLSVDPGYSCNPPGARCTIAPEYTGDGNWHAEVDFVPGAGLHNLLFSTEIQYWFRFEVGFAATLAFLGDDDVWVFVNGVLALDLGGLHVPEQGTVTIDAASAATYELEPGNVYSIKIFHAERNPTGSSFKLTLSGFQNARTECRPICGDGIVSLGEECDDVANDGGYGECEPLCKVGPRCGDRIVQEFEDCDDGNRIDGDGCGSACRQVVIR